MMNNQKIYECEEAIERQNAIQDWCDMPSRIAEDKYGIWAWSTGIPHVFTVEVACYHLGRVEEISLGLYDDRHN